MAKKKKEMSSGPRFPRIHESFGIPYIGGFYLPTSPSVFNGQVNIKRYRITIEEITEPIKTLQERLEQLWLECDNYHNWEPLQNAAKELGYTFKGNRGSVTKK